MSGTALVTGAARGIGGAVVRRLALAGWDVVASDLDPAVETLAGRVAAETGQRVTAVVGDVSTEPDVQRAVDALAAGSAPYAAVANAGVGGPEVDLVDLPVDDFDRVVAVNLRGVYLTLRGAGALMRERGAGSMVAVGSMYGTSPVPKCSAYAASKAGVAALVVAAAHELGPHGVRVNAVAPGYVDTEMRRDVLRERAAETATSVQAEQRVDEQTVPLRRYGTADDVAAAVCYLLSADAGYVTGDVLAVDGGVRP